MTKQLFGTDGIRGLPGEFPLDDATLDRVGMALGEYVSAHGRTPRDRPRVLIGRDTRESGPHIAERIARGLAAAGVEPISAGVLTTPGVAWLVNREGFAAGVVISASHNPYHDNGVKLISATGMKFPDAVEGELERFILSSNEPAEARKPPAKDEWKLFVFKGADILETIELSKRSCWLIGRELAVVDMAAEHPSISKQHAVIQFRYIEKKNEFGDRTGKVKPYIIDLESANGTLLNKEELPPSRYLELRDKDMIQFGHSTREYVLMLSKG